MQHFNILRWTPQQKSAWISVKILLLYLLLSLTVVKTLLRSKVHFSESFMQNKCDYHVTTVELTNREMHSYLILIISPDKHIGLVLLLLYFCNFSRIRHGVGWKKRKKERIAQSALLFKINAPWNCYRLCQRNYTLDFVCQACDNLCYF